MPQESQHLLGNLKLFIRYAVMKREDQNDVIK